MRAGRVGGCLLLAPGFEKENIDDDRRPR